MKARICSLALGAGLMIAGSLVQAADLRSVYDMALEGDPQLRAAEAGSDAAYAGKSQSRAPLLPQVNLSANMTQNSYDVVNGDSDSYMSQGYSLSLVQSIYHHDYYKQLNQAEAAITLSNAQLDATRQGLILRVADAYFQLLSSIDSLEFANAEKRAISQQLKQTKQRFEVGLTAITDVHEAQAGHDAVIAQVIAAQNNLDIAKEQLYEIIGRVPPDLAALTEDMPLITPDPADIEQWVELALDQNLELLVNQVNADIAREEMSRTQAGHYPTLDLVASHNYSDTTDWSLGNERTDTRIGLQLNVPIYSGGLTSASHEVSRAQYIQAEEGLEQVRRAVVRQTRSSYLNVRANIGQVQARKQALSSAQTALEATQAGFEVGTRTAVDVLNAQRERYGALRDYSRARYDYILATLALKQAAGTLNEEDVNLINGWLQ